MLVLEYANLFYFETILFFMKESTLRFYSNALLLAYLAGMYFLLLLFIF